MGEIEIHTVRPQEVDGLVEYHLSFGNKHLLVSFNQTSTIAETELTTIDGPKIDGATTELYKKTKEILQREAETHGPITFRLVTGFSSMKAWTQTTGNELFHWNNIYHQVDDPQKIVAEAIIEPLSHASPEKT